MLKQLKDIYGSQAEAVRAGLRLLFTKHSLEADDNTESTDSTAKEAT